MSYRILGTFLRRSWVVAWVIAAGAGCGYSFQGSHTDLIEKEGIQKIYIPPLGNTTFKAGVENVVYNNLVRTLIAHRRVTLVKDPSEADAILQGTVQSAGYSGSAGSPIAGLYPSGLGSTLGSASFGISTEYSANLSCSFSLVRRGSAPPGKKQELWKSSFTRSKTFPAANQLDVPGTTSQLINDSEFDRALSDLAKSMMDDVHESMLAMF